MVCQIDHIKFFVVLIHRSSKVKDWQSTAWLKPGNEMKLQISEELKIAIFLTIYFMQISVHQHF